MTSPSQQTEQQQEQQPHGDEKNKCSMESTTMYYVIRLRDLPTDKISDTGGSGGNFSKYAQGVTEGGKGQSSFTSVTDVTSSRSSCVKNNTSARNSFPLHSLDSCSFDNSTQPLSSLSSCKSKASAMLNLNNEVRSGLALRRTYSDFVSFDARLREELLCDPRKSSVPAENDDYLPCLPKPPSMEERTASKPRPKNWAEGMAQRLTDYMTAVIHQADVVRSFALSNFLSVDRKRRKELEWTSVSAKEGGGGSHSSPDRPGITGEQIGDGNSTNSMSIDDSSDRSSRRRLYLDYLLQQDMDVIGRRNDRNNVTVAKFQIIPRREPYVFTIETLPPGWWIVWQFRIESGIPSMPPIPHLRNVNVDLSQVEFTVSIEEPIPSEFFAISAENGSDNVAQTESSQLADSTERNDLQALTDENYDAASVNVDDDISTSTTSSTATPKESPPPTATTTPIASRREVVHRERCHFASPQPFRGSYRFHPDFASLTSSAAVFDTTDDDEIALKGTACTPPTPARATLTFKNVGHFSLLSGAKVWLECTAVPHEAFRAACAAAYDQNIADGRRENAPLWKKIVDSGGNVHLVVEAYPSYEDDSDEESKEEEEQLVTADNASSGLSEAILHHQEGGEAASEDPNSEIPTERNDSENATGLDRADMSSILAVKDQEISSLQHEVASLRRDLQTVRAELTRSNATLEEAARKLRLIQSERRVWNVAREEIQAEMTRLADQVTTEKRLRTEYEEELENARKEIQELRGEVKFLQRQLEADEEALARDDHDRTFILELERKVESLKQQNGLLEATIEIQKKTSNDLLVHARADADEARMMQRIFEGKVRELEKKLSEDRSTASLKTLEASSGKAVRSPLQKVENRSIMSRAMDSVASSPCSSVSSDGSASVPRSLDFSMLSFQHPDKRLNKQLVELRERHATLVMLLERNPNNKKNAELARKIEKAIRDIMASAIPKAPL